MKWKCEKYGFEPTPSNVWPEIAYSIAHLFRAREYPEGVFVEPAGLRDREVERAALELATAALRLLTYLLEEKQKQEEVL